MGIFCRIGIHIWREFLGDLYKHESRFCLDCQRMETRIDGQKWGQNKTFSSPSELLDFSIGRSSNKDVGPKKRKLELVKWK